MSKQLVEIQNSSNRTLRIDWDPGNTCNYKCWYCFPDSNTGTVPWPEKGSRVSRNLAFLIMNYLASTKIDNVRLTILGGEPTLWPELGNVVQDLKSLVKVHITVLTNGSRTLRWWEKYAEYFDHVTISVHHQSADIEHIKLLTRILDKHNVFYHVQVLMDHTAWNKCVDILDDLATTSNRFLLVPKAITIDGVSCYTSEQQQFLKKGYYRLPGLKQMYRNFKELKQSQRITARYSDGSVVKTHNVDYFLINNDNHFSNWQCDLGISKLFIDRQGRVTGTCEQLLYGLDHYFNINDQDFVEKFRPTLEPVVCSKLSCMCSGETIIAKRRTHDA